jgi:hypothetical protein
VIVHQDDSNPAVAPAPEELKERIRTALDGATTRRSLASLGVSATTMLGVLAGMPVSRGSLASIREALARLEGTVDQGAA